ncbi:CshA/CshB family fibrillar adhesin-related protein [Actinomyces sp. oral taxon 170]|uniref:CshA/CshB family fibrillar adhesin-related protein n=1 Tax=Actinomyces sp. oral taxon 170 TaxID=712117 RepID=UPI00155A3727|nr:CshA/CshB family fibrillar adhesin-related protein [Actinomyces sp. oral taxon 170]
MLRRLFVRSHRPALTSARRSSCRSRRRRRAGASISALALASTVLGTVALPVPQAEAVHGNPSGGGKFTRVIDWIDWTGMTNTRWENSKRILPDGASGVTWSTPSQISSDLWRTSRCTISDVRTTAAGRNDPKLTTHAGIQVEYKPGSWWGDGLARLYNDGRNYSAGVAKNPNVTSSNLPLGIANLQDASTHQFKIDCQAYVVTSSTQPRKADLENFPNKTEVPMEGMVFADAEASNWSAQGSQEYISVAPEPSNPGQNVSYYLMESARTAGCTTNSWVGVLDISTASGTRRGLKLRPDAGECSYQISRGYGPSSVMFISNSKSGYVEIHGGGNSAVALGVVSYIDLGDAPATYGAAGSVFQPLWSGGLLSGRGQSNIPPQTGPDQAEPGIWYNLSQAADQNRMATAKSALVRLGALTDTDEGIAQTTDASGDDVTDTDDEDALPDDWDRVIWTDIGQKWSQQISCSGTDTKVAGWVDWNRDGSFSSDERSEVTSCSRAGKANLTWTVPQGAKRSTLNGDGAATFMRLRITGPLANGQAAEDPQPTGIALNGEVEDHQVQVQLPNLTMVKEVDNTAAGSLGLSANDWTLTASPKSGTAVSGAGGFSASYLPQGKTVLSESSSSAKSAGYKATITCAPHPNSDLRNPASTLDAASKTLDLATGEWMTCTVLNTALPGQVIWSKVDDAGNALAGTVFTLASSSVNNGQVEVADCATGSGEAACPNGSVDQDPRAGYFKVVGLTWGEYSLTETQAPTGYQISGETLTKTLDGSAPAAGDDDATPTLDLGQLTNSRIKGSATWTKTDERGNAIKGAQWSLTPLDPSGEPLPDLARTITDCTDSCTQGGLDTDANPGAFKLTDLGYGSYRLIETRAPAGYILDATPHTITISTQDQVVALGNISNRKSVVPAIPLTGGSAATTYLIAGGVLLGITALAVLVQARHRRRARDS